MFGYTITMFKYGISYTITMKQKRFSRLSLNILPTIECDVCGRLNAHIPKFTTNTLQTICEPCIVENPEWIKINTTTEKPSKLWQEAEN